MLLRSFYYTVTQSVPLNSNTAFEFPVISYFLFEFDCSLFNHLNVLKKAVAAVAMAVWMAGSG